MELITFQIFDNYLDAHMLRVKLESEDIQCFIFDENIVTLNRLFANAMGGIKLKIRSSDYNRVQNIVGAINTGQLIDESDQIICPQCGSQDLISGFKRMKGIKGILSLVTSLFLVTYPLYFDTFYKCRNCGTEFKHDNTHGVDKE